MEIKYIGHSSFFIRTKDAKVVTDPYDPKFIGLKFPKTEADIVTISHKHEDHNFLGQINGTPLVIDWPGQYERLGVRIAGYRHFHDNKKGAERGENILFKIEDDISVLHCGDIGTIPDDGFLDEIGEVDVLMVPVGGKYTIDAVAAVELVRKIEPSIVIPMHYSVSGMEPEFAKSLTPVSDFLKRIGSENVVSVPKLVLKKDELMQDMKVVIISPL